MARNVSCGRWQRQAHSRNDWVSHSLSQLPFTPWSPPLLFTIPRSSLSCLSALLEIFQCLFNAPVSFLPGIISDVSFRNRNRSILRYLCFLQFVFSNLFLIFVGLKGLISGVICCKLFLPTKSLAQRVLKDCCCYIGFDYHSSKCFLRDIFWHCTSDFTCLAAKLLCQIRSWSTHGWFGRCAVRSVETQHRTY